MLKKEEIEEVMKDDAEAESVCTKIEQKHQEKLKGGLLQKKQGTFWKEMNEPKTTSKFSLKAWRGLNVKRKCGRL